jgi:hypothetical protein
VTTGFKSSSKRLRSNHVIHNRTSNCVIGFNYDNFSLILIGQLFQPLEKYKLYFSVKFLLIDYPQGDLFTNSNLGAKNMYLHKLK